MCALEKRRAQNGSSFIWAFSMKEHVKEELDLILGNLFPFQSLLDNARLVYRNL